jgi:hypothetical protein
MLDSLPFDSTEIAMPRQKRLSGVVLILIFSSQVSLAGEDEILDWLPPTVESAAEIMRQQYVFPELGAKAANQVLRKLQSGEYASISGKEELADALTDDLREFSGDSHVAVKFDVDRVQRERARQNETAEELALRNEQGLQRSKDANFVIQGVSILSGNIGYLRFDEFDNKIHQAGPFLAAFMDMLATTDAVIIDLRWNIGGHIDAIAYYLGYFFGPEPVRYGTVLEPWQGSEEAAFTVRDVAGSTLYDKPVYILTSGITFSAAEHFSYHMQVMERATIVGDKTYGGAVGWDRAVLNDEFLIRIPRIQIISAVTGEFFEEGVGVFPDIPVAHGKAMERAHLAALDDLLSGTNDEDEIARLQWAQRIALARASEQALAESGNLDAFEGTYGSMVFKVEDDKLLISVNDHPFAVLEQLSTNIFFDNRTMLRQVKFLIEDGEVAAILAYNEDGSVSEIKKETAVSRSHTDE